MNTTIDRAKKAEHVRCPECRSLKVALIVHASVVKPKEPEMHLECDKCGHQWEDSSPVIDRSA